MSDDGEVWVDGETFYERVHPREACVGRTCVFHKPTDHHMRSWTLVMRSSGLMERVCEHGVGHPDPDSLTYYIEEIGVPDLGIHNCDGCCQPGVDW